MAQNKSNKSTPSSRSGYFPELTASAGKQTSFLLPVRIKMTPNTTAGPLSDGKRNPAKMMQPVLIKDLLASTNKKERPNTSASTQKKKKPQRSTQPFLNTQSCYKPKKEEGETSFLYRKSCGGNKVRRQLYQTLDSPHKSAAENKENKPKKKMTRNTEETAEKNTAAQSKSRKSLLLPPNSIKNTFMRKSVGTSLKPPKVLVKNNKVSLGKSSKGISRVTEAGKLQKNVMKSSIEETEDELNTDVDLSSPEIDLNDKKKSCIMQDNFTMTSPIDRQVNLNKSLHSTSKLNRLITDPFCSDMKNLDISKTPCKCTEKSKLANETKFDFAKMCNLDYSGFIQMKTFLEQSIQACEDQASKLKQILKVVNNIFINSVTVTANSSSNAPTASVITTTMNTPLVGTLEVDAKCNVSSSTIDDNLHESNTTNAINKTLENVNTSDKTSNLAKELDKIKVQDETNKVCAEDKLPIPIKILVTEADLHQELKESSSEMLTELARLSTIGEVSCEVDLSNKDENDDTENKENINVLENSTMMLLTPTTPKTPKILRCRRSSSTDNNGCDSQARRRSARLAAKRASSASLDTSDKQDSFTTLENELNVVVNEKLSSKSLPASPMKPPSTPGIVKQFDKSIHRPLKEYMALKMNGTFLVTPDVKRFQSCFESTDTPHSRKSLSRKIFMELCDLYAESPEHE